MTLVHTSTDQPRGRGQLLGLRVTSPAPRDVWRELIAKDPNVLVTQTPEWLDCICALGAHVDASRLYELPQGRQLVLPMVRTRRMPAALATEASLPEAWGFGGLVGDAPIHVQEIATVLADLRSRRVMRTCIRPNPLAGQLWASARPPGVISIPRLAHVLSLEGGWDEVWARRFKGTVRTHVRKAERSGLSVECDTTGRLVPAFYDLFRRSVGRWATQQHEPLALARWRAARRDPLSKFQRMAQALGGACSLWIARLEGRPVAGILVLKGANAHYTRGAMDKEAVGSTGANELLHRLAIEDACRTGCRYYHMGESGASAALAQFKTRFGAVAHPYAEYRIEQLPVTDIDARLRGLAKRAIGFKDA